MNWKDWSYWLKGGVVFAIIPLLFYIMLRIINPGIESWAIGPFILILFGHSNIPIFPIIVYFLIGALIGWIYGKVKNKN